MPIEKIEKDTRANALKIKKATGAAPGGRTADQRVANEGASSRAAADPGQGGQWSPVLNTPVVPVFQTVLPNGKVLMWDSVGDQPAESYPNHTFTRATVWDPTTNTSKQVNVTGYNIFCAGYVQLADGRVLVAGGNKSQALDGIVQTHIFDWRTETWTRGPNMNAARWYPSVAALANGEALIVGGGPATAEVYQTDTRLRRLTGFTSFDDRSYPFLVPRPDGQVELVGPYNRMDTMSTAGIGALTATRNRDGISRTYGSFAIYDIGKVIVAGGGSVTEDGRVIGSHEDRRGGRRQRFRNYCSLHGLHVGRTSTGQPDRPGGRQRAGHRRAELVRERVGRPAKSGLRRRTVGSGHRDLDRAGQRQPSTAVPLHGDAAAGRPRDDRWWRHLWHVRHRRATWRRTSSTSRRPICSPRTAPEARRPVR